MGHLVAVSFSFYKKGLLSSHWQYVSPQVRLRGAFAEVCAAFEPIRIKWPSLDQG